MMKTDLAKKLKVLISDTPSKWREESDRRFEDIDGLRYSQQIAISILRSLREKKMSQKDLADLLKVTPQTVNKWVKGSENLGIFTIGRIEKALEIKLLEVKEDHINIKELSR